jgi:hypothetical protein
LRFILGAGITPAARRAGDYSFPGDSAYRFLRAFFLDSRVFACSLDFFRLRRRLISFCRSLAI